MPLALGPGLRGAAVVSLLLLAVSLGPLQLLAGGSAPTAPTNPAKAAAHATFGKRSLNIIENRGQIDRRAEYYAPGEDASVYFTRDGLSLSLADKGRRGRRYGLKLDFVGARADARPVGLAKTPTVVSYFKGPRTDWKVGIPTYSRVAYPELWPGIDLIYSGAGTRLKYSFLVRPGADPADIQLAWQGSDGVKLTRGGQLRVSTPAGVIRDDAPYAYQTVGGKRHKVDSSYALAAGRRYGFRVRGHDRTRPLVIDPAVLVYSGFIGGSGDEAANNVALDGEQNVYVTGTTTSPDFPATGVDTTAKGGANDGFVAKLKADGSGLAYAAYIGGSDFDDPINLAVDRAGAAYVCGSTGSSEAEGFPVTVGPDVTYNGGPQDAWVVKVNPAGTRLDYAGYIGGRGTGLNDTTGSPNEQCNGIDVDAAGSAYLSGFTKSDQTTGPHGGFPDGDGFGSVPGFDQTFNSYFPPLPDAWSVEVNPAGTGLVYATYIGGGNADAGTGLVMDSTGVYVNVFTSSNEAPYDPIANFRGGFPRGEALGPRPGFDQTFNGPDRPTDPVPVDAGAVKLNLTGTDLIYWTYIGGSGSEQPFGNSVDSAGNLYMTGRTNSTEASFPDGDGFGSVPGFDRTYNGGSGDPEEPGGDAFVVKLNPAGTGLAYGTYVGGSGDEIPVAIDASSGSAHIAGTTDSSEATFPATAGPDSTYNGGEGDAFVARLTASGETLAYAGFIGGSLTETGLGMAVDAAGNAYTAGNTDSNQCRGFPVTIGPDLTFNGPFASRDAFVAKIDPTGTAAGPRPNPVPGCATSGGPAPGPSPTPPFSGCPTLTANVINGSAADNSIVGTPGADRIFAGAGDDIVDARGGNDCVDLGRARDRGQGGPGQDLIVGGSGADRISGSSGNDRLGGDSGNDRVSGGSGRDRVSGGSGRDDISGGSGNDRISSRDGRSDRVDCGRGRDRVVADRLDRVARNCERVSRSRSRSASASSSLVRRLGGVDVALSGLRTRSQRQQGRQH